MTTNVINKGWFNPISLSVLLILVIVSAVLYVSKIINIPIFILLLLLSGLVTSAIRIADQWERAVVLRMGKYNGLKGPGPFMIIPVIDSVSTYIDQRVRVSAFKAEQTLTKDTVPVNVDAVVYWTVVSVSAMLPLFFKQEYLALSSKKDESRNSFSPYSRSLQGTFA